MPTNEIFHMTYRISLKTDFLERLVGSLDDGSQQWWEKAVEAGCQWIEDNPQDALENHLVDGPDVEV